MGSHHLSASSHQSLTPQQNVSARAGLPHSLLSSAVEGFVLSDDFDRSSKMNGDRTDDLKWTKVVEWNEVSDSNICVRNR